jgi:glycosyltransferase involved in cell wall biosynthesis
VTTTKRVVLFTPGHTEPGGAAQRSRLIAAALVERGWDVRVVTRAGTRRRFALRRDPGLTVLEVPGLSSRRLGAALFLLCAIPVGYVWSRRARAILAIQLSAPAVAAGVCGLTARRPYLAITSTSGALSEVGYVLHARPVGVRRRLFRRAAWLVGQTDTAARELRQLTAPDRIAVIPNPVAPRPPAPLDGDHKALYSGRLSVEKDLFGLLRAWRSVQGDDPGARLYLVGAGGEYRPVEAELRAAVAADPVLARSVEFTGWVSDVEPWLRSTDVYIFPSLSEGMSNSLLEACAWRRVVVASDIEPNRAVLGDDYPLLFPASDVAAMADAIRRAFSDPEVRSAALEHIDRRLPRFSIERVTAELERLIAEAPAP